MLLSTLLCGLLIAPPQDVPELFPDEYLYGGLAQSLAGGEGLTFRGNDAPIWNVLYAYVVAPAWALRDGEGGYALAKVLNALLLSSTAIPVWLLGRRLVAPRAALVAAALTLAGSWMAMSAHIQTENLALPLATCALMATVMTLREPGSRWMWITLGLIAVATYCRIQLAALAGVLLVAVVLDVLAQPRERRAGRARAHRTVLALGAGIVALGLLVLAVDSARFTQAYAYATEQFRPPLGDVLEWTGKHVVALVVMTGVIPAAAAVALAARRQNWRDPDSGPVLSVLVAGLVVMTPVVGWFTAVATHWIIERYVVYLVPLLFLALVLAPGRIGRREAFIGAGVASAALLFVPEVGLIAEGRGTAAARFLAQDVFSDRPRVGVVLIGSALAFGTAWFLSAQRAVRSAQKRQLLIAGVLLVVLLATTVRAVRFDLDYAHDKRADLPAELDWVNKATGGQRAGLLQLEHHELNYDNFTTEFFNHNIDTVYKLPRVRTEQVGRDCALAIGPDGALTTAQAGCKQLPPRVVIENGVTRARLHNEVDRIETVYTGNLVTTSDERPRLLSLVAPPCNDRAGLCSTVLQAKLWLDAPARLRVRFRGGVEDNFAIARTGEEFDIPRGVETSFALRVPAGRREVRLQTSWLKPRGAPKLLAVTLEQDGRSIPLY